MGHWGWIPQSPPHVGWAHVDDVGGAIQTLGVIHSIFISCHSRFFLSFIWDTHTHIYIYHNMYIYTHTHICAHIYICTQMHPDDMLLGYPSVTVWPISCRYLSLWIADNTGGIGCFTMMRDGHSLVYLAVHKFIWGILGSLCRLVLASTARLSRAPSAWNKETVINTVWVWGPLGTQNLGNLLGVWKKGGGTKPIRLPSGNGKFTHFVRWFSHWDPAFIGDFTAIFDYPGPNNVQVMGKNKRKVQELEEQSMPERFC